MKEDAETSKESEEDDDRLREEAHGWSAGAGIGARERRSGTRLSLPGL